MFKFYPYFVSDFIFSDSDVDLNEHEESVQKLRTYEKPKYDSIGSNSYFYILFSMCYNLHCTFP